MTTEGIEDYTINFVSTHGHRLAYIAHHPERTRTPLVFIHGLTASVRFWEAGMPDEVRRHYPWYSVSLPLHHPSTAPADLERRGLDEQLLCELFDDVLRELEPKRPVILIGYSIGAFAALNYAAKRPERVRGVVSIGGFMQGRARGLERVLQELSRGQLVRRTLFNLSWRIMQSHPIFLKLAVCFYAHDVRALLRYVKLDPTLQMIFPDVREHNIHHMRLFFRYLLDMNVMDEIHRIKMPVLVFAGERDPIIPYRHQREYASNLPDCHFCSIPGTGHVPFAERPEVFEQTFINWLRNIG